MNRKKKLRLILLGVLLIGLLLMGIGVGVCTLEVASFTYGGTVVPNESEVRELKETVEIEDQYSEIYVSPGIWVGEGVTSQQIQVVEDPQQKQGTVEVRISYVEAPGTKIVCDSYPGTDDMWRISTYPQTRRSGLESLMAVKDQLLKDLDNRVFRDYQMAELRGLTVTVNPADRGRIYLKGTLEWLDA